MLSEVIRHVGENFIGAREQPIANHPLAAYLRQDAREEVANVITRPDFIVKGSPGQAPNWADVPWIGIFNPDITNSAERAYYVVYLFASTMDRVALCLGQAVTEARKEFHARAIEELLRRSALIRQRVPEYKNRFLPGPVDLSARTRLAKDYESAPAFYCEYMISKLPHEDALVADLREMVRLYDLTYLRGGVEHLGGSIELLLDKGEKDPPSTIDEQRKYIRHNRIDRRSNGSQKAKDVHGYQCQVCGFDYEKVYGELGAKYIEAHHLVPLASLPEGVVVSMDPRNDFAVLCANCHRMLHRHKNPLMPEEVRNLPGVKNMRDWFQRTK